MTSPPTALQAIPITVTPPFVPIHNGCCSGNFGLNKLITITECLPRGTFSPEMINRGWAPVKTVPNSDAQVSPLELAIAPRIYRTDISRMYNQIMLHNHDFSY